MEGIFISFIVFASIIGCVIYYALSYGKFGQKAEKITKSVIGGPIILLDKASKSVKNKSILLSKGLNGVRNIVIGLTTATIVVPLGVGAAVYEGTAALGRSVSRGVNNRRRRNNMGSVKEPIVQSSSNSSMYSQHYKLNNINENLEKYINEIIDRSIKILSIYDKIINKNIEECSNRDYREIVWCKQDMVDTERDIKSILDRCRYNPICQSNKIEILSEYKKQFDKKAQELYNKELALGKSLDNRSPEDQ